MQVNYRAMVYPICLLGHAGAEAGSNRQEDYHQTTLVPRVGNWKLYNCMTYKK